MDKPTSWAVALKSFASNSSGRASQKAFKSRVSLAWPVASFEDEEGSSLMTRSMCCWSTSLMDIAVWKSSSLQVRGLSEKSPKSCPKVEARVPPSVSNISPCSPFSLRTWYMAVELLLAGRKRSRMGGGVGSGMQSPFFCRL